MIQFQKILCEMVILLRCMVCRAGFGFMSLPVQFFSARRKGGKEEKMMIASRTRSQDICLHLIRLFEQPLSTLTALTRLEALVSSGWGKYRKLRCLCRCVTVSTGGLTPSWKGFALDICREVGSRFWFASIVWERSKSRTKTILIWTI